MRSRIKLGIGPSGSVKALLGRQGDLNRGDERPTITYAAMTWWFTLKYKTSHAKLSKLRRLACPCIRRTMRMVPTAVIEALLGLCPLHLNGETEAQVGI